MSADNLQTGIYFFHLSCGIGSHARRAAEKVYGFILSCNAAENILCQVISCHSFCQQNFAVTACPYNTDTVRHYQIRFPQDLHQLFVLLRLHNDFRVGCADIMLLAVCQKSHNLFHSLCHGQSVKRHIQNLCHFSHNCPCPPYFRFSSRRMRYFSLR